MRDLANAKGHRFLAGGGFPIDELGNATTGLWASPSRLPARSRGEHRTASADCPRNRLMFALRSRGFQMQKRQEFERSRMNQSSPKAEVRGSNPFGRAICVQNRE